MTPDHHLKIANAIDELMCSVRRLENEESSWCRSHTYTKHLTEEVNEMRANLIKCIEEVFNDKLSNG